nr:unnamed protein product [Callosobruchus chinensis]
MRCVVVGCDSDNQSKLNPCKGVKFFKFARDPIHFKRSGYILAEGKTNSKHFCESDFEINLKQSLMGYTPKNYRGLKDDTIAKLNLPKSHSFPGPSTCTAVEKRRSAYEKRQRTKLIHDIMTKNTYVKNFRIQKGEAYENVDVHKTGDSEEKKKNLGAILQKKWKGLRDGFVREMKKKKTTPSGSGASGRSRYIYFERLITTSVTPDEQDLSGDGDDVMKPPVSQTKKRKKLTAADEAFLTVIKSNLTSTKQPQISNQMDPDDDKLFCLSLHKELLKVSEENRLQTKIELMKVLQAQQAQYARPVYLPSPQYHYETGMTQRGQRDYSAATGYNAIDPSTPSFPPTTFTTYNRDTSEKDRVCTIVFYKLKVRKECQYDQSNDCIMKPYDYVEVVLIKGIFKSWKQPIFYDFDCKMISLILMVSMLLPWCQIWEVQIGGITNNNELNISENKPYF